MVLNSRVARRRQTAEGQAATETMLSMMFLMLFIWGAVHMSMFAISKYMASYGAFYAARTAMVSGGNVGYALRVKSVCFGNDAGCAAQQAMGNWGVETLVFVERTTKTYRGVSREVVRTTSIVPFGAPLMQMLLPWVRIYGYAPIRVDPNWNNQSGDNGDK